ncbi:MAG: hypothetical protein K6C33_05810 [Desulfovibrio sp.]|nr:hypothetical protein [Desulfovibrio sp.]
MLDKVKDKLGSAAGAVTSVADSAASVAGSLRDRLRAGKHAEDKPEAPASAQEGGQAEDLPKSRLASLASDAGSVAASAACLFRKGVGGLCGLASRRSKDEAQEGQSGQDRQAGHPGEASPSDSDAERSEGKQAFVKKTLSAAAAGTGKAARALAGVMKHGAGAFAGLVARRDKATESRDDAFSPTIAASAPESQAEGEARAMSARLVSESLGEEAQKSAQEKQARDGRRTAFDATASAAGSAKEAAGAVNAFGAKMFSSSLDREAQEEATGGKEEGDADGQPKAGRISTLLSATGSVASGVGTLAKRAARSVGTAAGAAAGLLSRKGKKTDGEAEDGACAQHASAAASEDASAAAGDAESRQSFVKKACSAAATSAEKVASSVADAVKKGLGAAGGLLSRKGKTPADEGAKDGDAGASEAEGGRGAFVKGRLSALAAASGKAVSAAADSFKGGFGTLVKTVFSKGGAPAEEPASSVAKDGQPDNATQDAAQIREAGEAQTEQTAQTVQDASGEADAGIAGKGRFRRLLSGAGRACAGAAGSTRSVYVSLKDKFTTPKSKVTEDTAEAGAEAVATGTGFSFAKAASKVLPSKQGAWKAMKSAASFVKGEAGKLAKNLPGKEDFGKMKEGFAKLARRKAKAPRPEGPTQEEVWLGTLRDAKTFTSEELARARAEASLADQEVAGAQASSPAAPQAASEAKTTSAAEVALGSAPVASEEAQAEAAPATQEAPAEVPEAAEATPAAQEAPADAPEAAEAAPAAQEAPADAPESNPAKKGFFGFVRRKKKEAEPAEAPEGAEAGAEAEAGGEAAEAPEARPAKKGFFAFARRKKKEAEPAEAPEGAEAGAEAEAGGEAAEAPEARPAKKGFFGLYVRRKKKEADPAEAPEGGETAEGKDGEVKSARSRFLARFARRRDAQADGAEAPDSEGFLAQFGIGKTEAAGEEKAPRKPSKYNPVRLAKHAGGVVADGVTAVAKSVHPIEMMKSAGDALVDGAHSVSHEVKELKDRIQPLERIKNAGYATIDGASVLAGTMAGAVNAMADALHRKATGKSRAEDEDAGAMPVQMAGDTARLAADTVVATGAMGRTITSMAASAVTGKAALPYLREALSLVLKGHGELKDLVFYKNTLRLAVKLQGIKEVLLVTVNETVVDEDCTTLTFRNFSCAITAVEKGLELLASQRCPIGLESPKAASVLKGARWTGLVRQ